MNIFNTNKNSSLHSVNLWNRYAHWATNAELPQNQLLKAASKIGLAVLAVFVLIGSSLTFTFRDIPAFFSGNTSLISMIKKTFFAIGVAAVITLAGQIKSIIEKEIQKIKIIAFLSFGVIATVGLSYIFQNYDAKVLLQGFAIATYLGFLAFKYRHYIVPSQYLPLLNRN